MEKKTISIAILVVTVVLNAVATIFVQMFMNRPIIYYSLSCPVSFPKRKIPSVTIFIRNLGKTSAIIQIWIKVTAIGNDEAEIKKIYFFVEKIVVFLHADNCTSLIIPLKIVAVTEFMYFSFSVSAEIAKNNFFAEAICIGQHTYRFILSGERYVLCP